MKKHMIVSLCIVCLAFSAGMRPAFDLGFNWMGVKLSDDTYSSTENYTALRLATTVPYSRIVGLYVEIAALNWFEDGNEVYFGNGGMSSVGIGTKVGVMEVIPLEKVTPFFKQFIMIDRWSFDYGSTMTFTNIGFGAGIEFLSNSYVSPILEGGLSIGTQDYGDGFFDSSMSIFNYSVSGGLRFSWKK